eukprot:6946709-Lingulodinium_polyedra.AAC.1
MDGTFVLDHALVDGADGHARRSCKERHDARVEIRQHGHLRWDVWHLRGRHIPDGLHGSLWVVVGREDAAYIPADDGEGRHGAWGLGRGESRTARAQGLEPKWLR